MLRTRAQRDAEATGELDELVAAEARFRVRRENARAEAKRLIDEACAAQHEAEAAAERALEDELLWLQARVDGWRREQEAELARRTRALLDKLESVREDELVALAVDASLGAGGGG